jgi:hypothetical protein
VAVRRSARSSRGGRPSSLPTRATAASSKKNYIPQKLSGACRDLISRITGARDIGCFEIVPVGDDRLCPSESVLRDDAARCGFAFEVSCSCKFLSAWLTEPDRRFLDITVKTTSCAPRLLARSAAVLRPHCRFRSHPRRPRRPSWLCTRLSDLQYRFIASRVSPGRHSYSRRLRG